MRPRKKTGIGSLPPEIIGNIFSFFNTNELHQIRNVSKLFNRIGGNEYIKRHPLFDYTHPILDRVEVFTLNQDLRHMIRLSNNQLIIATFHKIFILKINNDELQKCFLTRIEPPSFFKGIVKLLDKYHFAAWDNENIYIWNHETKEHVCTFKNQEIIRLVPLPNDQFAISHPHGELEICHFSPAEPSKVVKSASRSSAFCLARLPNMQLVTGHMDGKLKIWDYQKEKYLKTLNIDKRSEVRNIIILSSDKLASSYADGSIRIWNYEKGKCFLTIESNVKRNGYMKYSGISYFTKLPNNQLLCISAEGRLQTIDYLNKVVTLDINLSNRAYVLSDIIGCVVLSDNNIMVAKKNGDLCKITFPKLMRQFKEVPDETIKKTRCFGI